MTWTRTFVDYLTTDALTPSGYTLLKVEVERHPRPRAPRPTAQIQRYKEVYGMNLKTPMHGTGREDNEVAVDPRES